MKKIFLIFETVTSFRNFYNQNSFKNIFIEIRSQLKRNTSNQELLQISEYYFDGKGKAFRPNVVLTMANAVNYQKNVDQSIFDSQQKIAILSEMIHTASLIHDDIIDQSSLRREKPSVNVLWNHKKVTQAGKFILAVGSKILASLKNDEVAVIMSSITGDLINGEFMQMDIKKDPDERFSHYLTKSFNKTASLMANSCKSVAVLANSNPKIIKVAFEYGKNLGMAFQIVDDLLDFISTSKAIGKPTNADLKLGLATAPVLIASEEHPELNEMIMRKFSDAGDVETALKLVRKSKAIEETLKLAHSYCDETIRQANKLKTSEYQKNLVEISKFTLNRLK